ncbi:MAG: SDR family NAD(P)-dependent oxidoreductase [bacterium]
MKNLAGKKAIITGGAGFLGTYFVEHLLKLGAEVVCVSKFFSKNNKIIFLLKKAYPSKLSLRKIDLLSYSEVKRGVSDADVIINCAAMDGNAEFKREHAVEIMDENIRIVLNVLRMAKENKMKNVVLVSTAEVYSPQAESPIVEEDDYRKYNDYIGNGYILSKRYSEVIGSLYEEQYGINVFFPRPTNMYGPRDHFDNQTNKVIPSMINKVLNGEPIEIWGDGSQVRQFIYVKDAVCSILRMVETNKYHGLNIATDEPISILELAKLIMEVIGKKEEIIFDTDRPTGAKFRVLDTTKLNSIVDFKFKSLREGIKDTVEWYNKEKLEIS